jgi:uncharacterized membrane protein
VKRRYLQFARWTLASVVVSIFAASVAEACPTCKDSLASDPVQQGMVKGYFYSILFMMSMPFLILSSLAAYFYYEVRKARRGVCKASPASAAQEHAAL